MKLLTALILAALPLYALGYTIGYSFGFVGETEVHYHAGFLIYENGQQVDLSGIEYMTIQPCDQGHSSHGAHDSKDYDAAMIHLHDGVGDVVHVHADGQTWRMFMDSLNLDADAYPQMYRDGVEATLMDDVIEPFERVVFADAGTEVTSQMIESVPSRERILEVENMSETCSS